MVSNEYIRKGIEWKNALIIKPRNFRADIFSQLIIKSNAKQTTLSRKLMRTRVFIKNSLTERSNS